MVNSGFVFLVASPAQHKYFSSQAGLSTSSLRSLRKNSKPFCHEVCTSPWQSDWSRGRQFFCQPPLLPGRKMRMDPATWEAPQVPAPALSSKSPKVASTRARWMRHSLSHRPGAKDYCSKMGTCQQCSRNPSSVLTCLPWSWQSWCVGLWELLLTAAGAWQEWKLSRNCRCLCRAGPAHSSPAEPSAAARAGFSRNCH